MKSSHRQWMYGPKGEGEIFEEGADIPAGWQDQPGAHPLDHDGDGKPGGSLKGAQSTRAKGAKPKK
jgi:hypothetical protein